MHTEEQLQEEQTAVPEQPAPEAQAALAAGEPAVLQTDSAHPSAGEEAAPQMLEEAQPVSGDVSSAPEQISAAAKEEEPFELVPTSEFKQIVETLLFITDRPLKPSRIADVIDGVDARRVREMILEIQSDYIRRNSAVQVVELGGGFQMSTKPEYGRWVRRLYNEKMTAKLSNAALETLAIVAYKQPITRAEMEAIRGVDVAGPLERLLERALVRVVGKKDTVGRPMVYGTTDEFLRMFGLNKISDLPDLQVFASKALHEKQEDLPFGDPLPPLAEPAIIPVEELEGEEKLEVLDSSADPFFSRTSYNRGDFFSDGSATPENLAQAVKSAEEAAPAEAGENTPALNEDEDPAARMQAEVTVPDNELASLQTEREESAAGPQQEAVPQEEK